MTYGVTEPRFIYGFREGNTDQAISYHFIYKYPFVGIFTDQIVKKKSPLVFPSLNPREAFYGIACLASEGYKIDKIGKKRVDKK